MTYSCCLCDASGEHREGRIREGEGVPLCAEHRAELRWKRSEPAVALPAPVELIAQQQLLLAAAV